MQFTSINLKIYRMNDYLHTSCHFEVMLTNQQQLVIECVFRGPGTCICEEPIQTLSLFYFETHDSYNTFTLYESNPIQRAAHQVFELGKDNKIEAHKSYHFDYRSLQMEVGYDTDSDKAP